MPPDVIDGSRTVIKPVGQRGDLIIGPVLGNFFKCTVNISNGRFAIQDNLAIHGQHILENTMCGRMRWSEI